MRLNPVFVQKALNSLSASISCLSQAIMPSPDDIKDYHAHLLALKYMKDRPSRTADPQTEAKAREVPPERPSPSQADPEASAAPEAKAAPEPEVKAAGEAKEDAGRRDEGAEAPAAPRVRKARKPAGGLPDKPMKLARMTEFLSKWEAATKARKVAQCSGFSPGMGCVVDGKEHVVKAIYDNGVALVNRRTTQYHRLVPVNRLEGMHPKPADEAFDGKLEHGQKIEVGHGLKSSECATIYRSAVVDYTKGDTVVVKYPDTGVTSTVSRTCIRESR